MGPKQGLNLNVGAPGTGLSHRVKIADFPKPESTQKASARTSRATQVTAAAAYPEIAQTYPTFATNQAVPINQNPLSNYPPPLRSNPLPQIPPPPHIVSPRIPGVSPSVSEIAREEVNNFNRAYDEIINQHRKILPPPLDPRRAFQKFLPSKPTISSYPLLLGALGCFAFLFVPGSQYSFIIGILAVFLIGLSFFLMRPMLIRQREWRTDSLRKEQLINNAISGHYTAIEELLGEILKDIYWVLETSASFELSPEGDFISIDVNLPEIEDLDATMLVCNRASAEQVLKKKWVRDREYLLLIHAIILRLAGEVFYYFPTIKNVLASGYTDRLNPRSNQIESQYIISAIFDRQTWLKISPQNCDPVNCLALFSHRRKIEDSYYLSTIIPMHK
jgi:hypothetical protein